MAWIARKFIVAENAEELFHSLCNRNGLVVGRTDGLSLMMARTLYLIALESWSVYSKHYDPGHGLKLSSERDRPRVIKQLTKKHELQDLQPLMDDLLRKEGILSDQEIALVLATRAICRSRAAGTLILRPIAGGKSTALGEKI